MYYHSRPLRHVVYGKVCGNPDPGEGWGTTYRWLSNYCGFFPQVWLSRSNGKYTTTIASKDMIMFGFEDVQGFPLDYNAWEMVMNPCLDTSLRKKDPVRDVADFNKIIEERLHEYYDFEPETQEDDYYLLHSIKNFASLEEWFENVLFVKNDQVVVPSLNLKAAKKVVCRNEKQKKKLRKMGFIEDRIEIRNMRVFDW